MTERVALTGATGFLGSNLLPALEKSNYPIKALTRRSRAQTGNAGEPGGQPLSLSPLEGPPHPGADSGSVSWINGDLDNRPALDELVEGCTSVIHCAGATRGNSLDDFLEVNLRGTENLLNAARKITPAPRFLLISSVAARYPGYSWYARSKAMAEELLMTDDYSALSRTIYRPTAVYGPGDREMRPLFRLMRRGFLAGAGTPGARISLIHVADLVNAICIWLQAKEAQGLFELDDGTSGGYRWEDIAAAGEAAWKRRIIRIRVPAPLLKCAAHANLLLARVFRYPAMLTPGKVNEITHENWVCDNTPLTATLGWKPEISLRKGIDTAI